MIRSISSAISFGRALWRNRRGTVVPLVAVVMTVAMGFVGMSIDIGRVLAVSNMLQGATDAAALAGANALIQPNATPTTATSAATAWANANQPPAVTVTAVSSVAKCLSTVANLPNCTSTNPNAVVVTQTATTPMTFARVIGIDSLTFSATATASKAGGSAIPLNIMIVLDATASMSGTTDTNCTVPGISRPSRLQCAEYGIQQILGVMVPPQDRIGLVVFPGNKTALATACSTPTTENYYTPGVIYNSFPFSTNYNDGSGNLNPSSNLVKAAGNRPTTAGCLQAPGGQSSYYAEAIAAAQTTLSQTAGVQNVMIVLSDGDANAGNGNMYCGSSSCTHSVNEPTWKTYGAKQCDAGVTAARAATNAGTRVYAVAYGSPTTACQTPGTYTPCTAMQNIASDPTRFFTTNSNCVLPGGAQTNPASQLPSLLRSIAYSLNKARLIPNS
jgi:Flp pilus assembly protein TadG